MYNNSNNKIVILQLELNNKETIIKTMQKYK